MKVLIYCLDCNSVQTEEVVNIRKGLPIMKVSVMVGTSKEDMREMSRIYNLTPIKLQFFPFMPGIKVWITNECYNCADFPPYTKKVTVELTGRFRPAWSLFHGRLWGF